MKTLAVAVTTLLLALVSCEETQKSPFIIGGNDASILDHPYMVNMHIHWAQTFWVPFCGGSIISRRSVLTAAHCLMSDFDRLATASDIRVAVGTANRDGTGAMFYDAFRLIRHPDYFIDWFYVRADIAIIRLVWPIIFTPVTQPIPLGRFEVQPGDRAIAIGFGLIGNEAQLPTRLQRIPLNAISNARCRWIHRNVESIPVTSEMACFVADHPNRGICGGDSGSPIEFNGFLVGVACWTKQPCGSGPAMYVRVSEHYDWIRANM